MTKIAASTVLCTLSHTSVNTPPCATERQCVCLRSKQLNNERFAYMFHRYTIW